MSLSKTKTWLNAQLARLNVDEHLDKASKVLEVADSAADLLVHVGDRLTPAAATALTMRGIHSFQSARRLEPEEVFRKGWVTFSARGMAQQLWNALFSHGLSQGVSLESIARTGQRAWCAQWGKGLQLGVGLQGNPQEGQSVHVEDMWIPEGQAVSETLRFLGQCLWVSMGTTKLVISAGEGRQFSIAPDEEEEIFPSERGLALYERLKSFVDKGYHRSVFMIGEPGVGKTSMLYYIAEQFGGLRVRVMLSQIEADPEGLIRIVEVLRPKVLIVNDIDRISGGRKWDDSEGNANKGSQLLDPLEKVNRMVPLFLTTANYSDGITQALLRPGRFDEMEEVDELEIGIIEKLLPGAPETMIKELHAANVPVAYIVELKKRMEVLGPEQAKKELDGLVSRADKVIRKVERKKKSKRKTETLVGKSHIERARILEKRAARSKTKADKADILAERERSIAEVLQKKAEEEREKAKTSKGKKVSRKEAKKASQEMREEIREDLQEPQKQAEKKLAELGVVEDRRGKSKRKSKGRKRRATKKKRF